MYEHEEERKRQLGMSMGKANNILNKIIIFSLAEKCGLTNCFRCGTPILNSEDISKDHIVDWLHSKNPRDLFFDINNISFSHKKCNKPRNQHGFKSSKKISKFKGVSRSSKKHKSKPWQCGLCVKGKYVFTGRFSSEIEAAMAYDSAVEKFYGAGALTNKSLGLL